MLLGSHNYGINMGFMLTFLLSGLGLSALLQTWRNLTDIRIKALSNEPTFVGQKAVFRFQLQNNRKTPRSAIQIKIYDEAGYADVQSLSNSNISVPYTANKRGWLDPGRFTVCTYFPMGLFYAWAYFEPEQPCLIYPKPAQNLADEKHLGGDKPTASLNTNGDEDFNGHRSYQTGDNINRLDWKALARGRGWLIKNYSNDSNDQLWLEWSEQSEAGLESRLSVLCRSVLTLSEQGVAFGLKIPGTTIFPGTGNRHKDACLKALALFYTDEDK